MLYIQVLLVYKVGFNGYTALMVYSIHYHRYKVGFNSYTVLSCFCTVGIINGCTLTPQHRNCTTFTTSHMVITWLRRLKWLATFFLFSALQWSRISWFHSLQLFCSLVSAICWCRFLRSKVLSRISLQSAFCSLETPANALREVVSWGRSFLLHQKHIKPFINKNFTFHKHTP